MPTWLRQQQRSRLSPAVVPTTSAAPALTLANVSYEKKGAIAYVTVNRPRVLNASNRPTWKDLTAFLEKRAPQFHGR
jgi:enoyl-CoA hydratase